MTSVLASAFAQGFTAEQVIQYLVKRSPKYAKEIARASGVGYTPKQILKYLTKDNPKERGAISEYEETRNRDQQNRTNANKAVIGGAVAATGLPIAASAGLAALSRALPRSLQNIVPQIQNAMGTDASNPNTTTAPTPSAMPQTPSNQIPVNASQQPPLNLGNANIQQPTDIQQPKQNSNIIDKLYSGFEKGRDKGFDFESDAFLKVAKRMKSTGEIRSKEDFERFFNLFDAKKNEGKDLPTALKEASIEYDNQKVSPTEQLTTNEKPESNELVEKPVEQPKIEKNSVVNSPQGVGEVREVRNGQALVEVDGKLHKVKEEDLESSPMPEKDLADLYDELISGIEKDTGEDVSRMVQWAGYNPETNTLQFLPHNGKLYKYGDISPEDAALLTDILSTRKTTGSNFIGAWKAGSKSPIGAALSKLIRKLQSERGGKGQEYEETHEPIYSAYEPAIEAKKRKKKKK